MKGYINLTSHKKQKANESRKNKLKCHSIYHTGFIRVWLICHTCMNNKNNIRAPSTLTMKPKHMQYMIFLFSNSERHHFRSLCSFTDISVKGKLLQWFISSFLEPFDVPFTYSQWQEDIWDYFVHAHTHIQEQDRYLGKHSTQYYPKHRHTHTHKLWDLLSFSFTCLLHLQPCQAVSYQEAKVAMLSIIRTATQHQACQMYG